MCFGAILIHRIPRIVYAFEDAMGGGTSLERSCLPLLYAEHDIEIVSGVCRQESLLLFHNFFQNPKNNYLSNSYLAEYVKKQIG
jgi:tRNA(adenine34) deaminase